MTRIVDKGTDEFREVKKRYFKIFNLSVEGDIIQKGFFTHGEHKGKFLGITSQKVLDADLPMPFGCPDLFIQPTSKNSVIWFCDRVGCICSCCREDMNKENEKYPNYCPPKEGFEPCGCIDDPEDFEDEYWGE